MRAGNLNGNRYVNVSLAGLIEIPADIVTLYLMDVSVPVLCLIVLYVLPINSMHLNLTLLVCGNAYCTSAFLFINTRRY